MDNRSPITDALKRLLVEVDADTGKTNWELLMEVIQEKAKGGDDRFAKLLKRAKAIQAANPQYTRGGQAGNE